MLCPRLFKDSLMPWLEYRSAQGFTLHLIDPEGLGFEDIKNELLSIHKKTPLAALLIVGNAVPIGPSRVCVSSPRIESRVIDQFGPENHIASDGLYADLNNDELPEIAVGRFSVDTPEQLETIIKKIKQYESGINSGVWQRKVNFIAGLGGFSPILDSTIESSTRYLLSRMIPPEYEVTLTQADWKSPYCPPPNNFNGEVTARLNEGCLFWVYMGHGLHRHLDYVYYPGQEQPFPILSTDDLKQVECKNGSPIVLFFACYTGAIDARENSIAEEMLRLENGPVAVVASTRTSMPYGMCSLGIELIEEVFEHYAHQTDNTNNTVNHTTNDATNDAASNSVEPLRLGTVILNAKRRMILRNQMETGTNTTSDKKFNAAYNPVSNTASTRVSNTASVKPKERPIREIIDSLAKMFDPTGDKLDQQRLDHLHLFQLLGDPLLCIQIPEKIEIEVAETVTPGSTLNVKGKLPRNTSDHQINHQVPLRTELFVEIAVPKSRDAVKKPTRKEGPLTTQTIKDYAEIYRKANQRTLTRVPVEIKPGESNFSFDLQIPQTLRGEYDLKVYFESQEKVAIGGKTITVK
ncbi:MAG: C25 family cysteine peptidase [Thermoguttaceae bacterium]